MNELNHQPPAAADQVETEVRVRVHGRAESPTLIHLPGLHGDWTLVAGFRKAVSQAVRFVEVTYPRSLTWSLADYAAGVQVAIKRQGIFEGWLLGESFGSQVLWEILQRSNFRPQGVILAGGFGRHPAPWMARLAFNLSNKVSFRLLKLAVSGYSRVARIRFRRSPENLASMNEFINRRTKADFKAASHRLQLVAENDPLKAVMEAGVPVYALTGLFDPIVPWRAARDYLRKNCRTMSGHRVIWSADHNVLGTAPNAAAIQVLQWISMPPKPDRGMSCA